jgi:hypothetical protein
MNRTLYLPRPWIRSQNPGKEYVKRAYWHRVVRMKLPRLARQKEKIVTPM